MADGKGKKVSGDDEDDVNGGYQQLRDQRIRENKVRMQSLGIFDIKSQLVPTKRVKRNDLPEKKTQISVSNSEPPRRSSRLKTKDPKCYSDYREKKSNKQSKDVEIFIPEGSQPEIYTEEHQKLLGDSHKDWTLSVDGHGEDGKRIYDPVSGETCHQCRQKTLGLHTHCSKCTIVQGQFCGDCLYMRYGENVIEVNKNPEWICPVCRDICNCSLCRKDKGWAPTGNLYRKVKKLGFKSVAHYLIQTRCPQVKSENSEDVEPSLLENKVESPILQSESLDAVIDANEPQLEDNEDDIKQKDSNPEIDIASLLPNKENHHDDDTNDADISKLNKEEKISVQNILNQCPSS